MSASSTASEDGRRRRLTDAAAVLSIAALAAREAARAAPHRTNVLGEAPAASRYRWDSASRSLAARTRASRRSDFVLASPFCLKIAPPGPP